MAEYTPSSVSGAVPEDWTMLFLQLQYHLRTMWTWIKPLRVSLAGSRSLGFVYGPARHLCLYWESELQTGLVPVKVLYGAGTEYSYIGRVFIGQAFRSRCSAYLRQSWGYKVGCSVWYDPWSWTVDGRPSLHTVVGAVHSTYRDSSWGCNWWTSGWWFTYLRRERTSWIWDKQLYRPWLL